ncbi:MAG: hypothetical protein ACU0CA_00940 [Paracoccaceae bacterium]
MNGKFLKAAGLGGILIVIFLFLAPPQWLGESDVVGAPVERPFDIADVHSQEIPDGLECDAVLSPSYAYDVYRSIQVALGAGKNTDEILYIDCFMPQGEGNETASEALVRFTSTVFLADVLYGYLEISFEDYLRNVMDEGDARFGNFAWRASYLGQAAFEGFMSTNETRFLGLYIKYFDRLMMLRDSELGYRDDYHKKIMASWGTTKLNNKRFGKPLWVSHVTHFSITMISATSFAREIQFRPELASYRPWADKVLEFFDLAYRQFDSDLRAVEGIDEQWFWRPLQDKYEATNHIHLQGQALLNVYAVTGNPLYKDRIEQFIRIFLKAVKYYDDGSVSWHYSPYFQVESAAEDDNNLQVAEYSRKGALTVPFLFKAEQDGFAVETKLMDALTLTIRDYITGGGVYKVHTHSFEGEERIEFEEEMKFHSISGYQYAASRDPKIEENILGIVSSQPENYRGGWFMHSALARSYGLLLNAAE